MKGKNIVLLHGWGAETKKLEPLKRELEILGWKVLLPKLAGFEKPAPKEVWGIREYSGYVDAEIKKAFSGQLYYVFGHSFGGGLTIKLASDNGENLRGIILCASRGISRGKPLKRMLFATLAKTGKILLIVPELADGFRKLLYKAAREHDYEKTQGIMKDVFKKIISEDLKPLVEKIHKPALILWGLEDRVVPLKDAYYLKSRIRDSKVVTFKNQGHRLPYEKPKELARQINRWSSTLN